MKLTEMDYVRAAIYNAAASGITFAEFAEMAAHAETGKDLDNAVNLLGLGKCPWPVSVGLEFD